MIVIYTSHGCASCRKVRTWLKDRKIDFIEKNIFKTLLNFDEIKYLLSRTNNGSDDIISKRSKIIRENKIDLDNISTNDLCKFVIENPSVLKRPIILSSNEMQIGYDEEDINAFIPKELRNIAKCDKNCPHYEYCGALRQEEEN